MRAARGAALAWLIVAGCGRASAPPPAAVRALAAIPAPPEPAPAMATNPARAGDAEWRVEQILLPAPRRAHRPALLMARFTVTNRGADAAVVARRPRAVDGQGAELEARDEDHPESPVAAAGFDATPLAPGASRTIWAVYDLPPGAWVTGFKVAGFRVEEGRGELALPDAPPPPEARRPSRRAHREGRRRRREQTDLAPSEDDDL